MKMPYDFDFKKSHDENFSSINYVSEIASIRDKNALLEVFDKYKPDVVFHAAAHKHITAYGKTP